jgi:hypothetical protein
MADGAHKKIEVARSAVYKIMGEVKSQKALFGMVVFNSTASVLFPLSPQLPSPDEVAERLVPSGKSAIWDALALGAELLRTVDGAVVGNMVLVTDGWDNMSERFHVERPEAQTAGRSNTIDLLGHLLPRNSRLKLQIIGIGSGTEKDKGVDTVRMKALVEGFSRLATEFSSPSTATYKEVLTGEELFSGMVNAFLDVPFEDSQDFDSLNNEDIASHAAAMAHALRESHKHSLVGTLSSAKASNATEATSDSQLEVDVATANADGQPLHWADRYGPLGEVAEAYVNKDWTHAEEILSRKGTPIHPITRAYWLARISYAKGDAEEASKNLTEAWIEADQLSAKEKVQIYRRLALLHAKISGDKEVQNFVEIFERAATRAKSLSPSLSEHLEAMFEKILDLRRTYALIRTGGAVEHERLVEEIFGLLQDARLEDKVRDPSIEQFLSVVEVTLSEMR